MANLAVSALIFDPSNADVLYAGTGEGFYNLDAVRGDGIFVSRDGGRRWNQLESTKAAKTTNFYFVNRIAVSADGAIILAATKSGLQRSTDRGGSWSAAHGIAPDAVMFDVKFQPGSSTKAVAAGGGLVVFSSDGGASWSSSSGFEFGDRTRTEVTYAKADPNLVYASEDTNGGTLLRSADAGASFKRVNTGLNYLGDQGWYDDAVWAGDPASPQTVVIGGIDLWLSTNGGLDFTRISVWTNDSSHADQHAIVSDSGFGTSNHSLLIGNDGGIYRIMDVRRVSPDSGWTSLNHNYTATQFYAAAANPSTGTIVGGTQDNGTLRYNPNDGWSTTYGGDGGLCVVDSVHGYFYGEYIHGDVVRSKDDGRSAEPISGHFYDGSNWSWKQAPYVIADCQAQTANFIAPLAIDPAQPTTLFVGGVSLWRTRNADQPTTLTTGPKWDIVKEENPNASPISAIAVATSSPDVMLVGHNDGSIFLSQNARQESPAWTRVSNDPHLPRVACTHLLFDATNPAIAYATFGAFDVLSNVWRTADSGSTWKDIHGNLPLAPVHSIAVHRKKPSFLYVASEVGVFGTENLGVQWSKQNEGPNNCSVDDLVWLGDALYAATHGRGMFKINIQ